MGRDIPTFPLDEKYLDAAGQGNLGHYPPNIQNLVVSLQNLHPQELRLFFHALFQSMSPASKQAVTEIMWIGLSPTERQLIELPFYQHRWSQHSIDAALRTAFSAANAASPTSPASGTSSDFSSLVQGALVPRRRFLSDMIELDLQMSPSRMGGESPFDFFQMNFSAGENVGQNMTLRDIVTGIIANTVSRRAMPPFSFDQSSFPPPTSGPGPGGPGAASGTNGQGQPPIE